MKKARPWEPENALDRLPRGERDISKCTQCGRVFRPLAGVTGTCLAKTTTSQVPKPAHVFPVDIVGFRREEK
jgi:uncharacterized OB-fold protein